MKKRIFFLVLGILFLSQTIWAATEGLEDVKEIFGNMTNAILSLAGVFCVIMIVVGALIYMTAREDVGQLRLGKTVVLYALLGLALIMSAVMILEMVVGFG